ncbi:putative [NAD] dependent malate oxidoreductase Mez (malic enzyme) (NAD-malic enzyme) (malate dehydrogenase (oxaloacetate decarboxylating)) (pyruvic-malic carboxylase) (NAD-me) [Mycobacterium tuberculosis H37Rv] [Mycobacterium shimoidei]|uniref:Putative [NAD] dependent malate oxidoreductase Mez (Malic enzyme) (NAD-malic enzyme) (Malate dehydrogenase (Oxaloacetate decarboxylating)) (Pyruvic-malic carboxylase) (NAD-me) [Mycobacterium tuberc... n=1 Tax=Mycobacterium shimoidei TaxID=29313 RepID=A0A375YYZ3_MYCSH|nr:NAD-dependent malic enzyme [Mycobacterium shimoidei]SRX94124.1 putative [NAD] dependent malate oxidoreductase Mez (malic enzyme) (NAD-malic enzyme) (malate dehydrogenase (oxaloacetate decarboxylating)) (pyruvic-malic carboxylase) (NAD-me) [Mycobacterium tuberculosis H37Rv] [Mycobacterium shimoidei]
MTHHRVPHIPPALATPSLNRGVGFTHEERRRLGLTGRLPSAVLTLDQQADRVWHQLQGLATDLARNLLLEQLHYRHELLYFKVLVDHLPELIPVVYTPTVGEAIQRFSDEYRGQRGLYLCIDRPDEIADSFATFELGPDDVDLIVCTDAESILGIGDWGVGGIQIAVGKLALYTAGAGIDPCRCIAVSLDVGTDNEQLLQDPFYLGNRHTRRRGPEYDDFINSYIETVHRLFPGAMLHFEDFGPANARAILTRYGPDYCVFNDDMQGTGAVVLAALYGGLKVTGIPMREQKVLIFGAGTAGIGVADQIRDAMVADGCAVEEATARIWAVDKQGVLFDDMDLRDFQVPYAKDRGGLQVSTGTRVGLLDAIKMVAPTSLIGCSTVFGAFTREVVAAMTATCERPLIFPLSNPTSRMEAAPADIVAWSNGKALVASGSPVPPIEYGGITYTIGQANNMLVFPGIGLGVVISGARRLTQNMLQAAAKAVAGQVDPAIPGASLLPGVENLRAVSAVVAEAVYHAAAEDGVASRMHGDVVQAILDAMWLPAYD